MVWNVALSPRRNPILTVPYCISTKHAVALCIAIIQARSVVSCCNTTRQLYSTVACAVAIRNSIALLLALLRKPTTCVHVCATRFTTCKPLRRCGFMQTMASSPMHQFRQPRAAVVMAPFDSSTRRANARPGLGTPAENTVSIIANWCYRYSGTYNASARHPSNSSRIPTASAAAAAAAASCVLRPCGGHRVDQRCHDQACKLVYSIYLHLHHPSCRLETSYLGISRPILSREGLTLIY